MSEHERRLGAYAPPLDDYDTFDARDPDQDRRGWLFLAAAAVVFALFVAVVWNTFQLGVRERSDSPIIAADAEPYRVAPEDPGGYETPDQDLTVHALRTGQAAPTEAAPVREGREEPVEPPARALPPVQIETADADALEDEPEADAAPEPAQASTEPVTQTPPAVRTVGSTPTTAAPVAAPSLDSTIESVLAERNRTSAESVAPVAQTPPPPSARAATGAFLVQIAAFRSEEEAREGWAGFTRREPELAAGRTLDIQRADLGEQGVYYRVRVAAFGTREEATTFCETLQRRGGSCMVARR